MAFLQWKNAADDNECSRVLSNKCIINYYMLPNACTTCLHDDCVYWHFHHHALASVLWVFHQFIYAVHHWWLHCYTAYGYILNYVHLFLVCVWMHARTCTYVCVWTQSYRYLSWGHNIQESVLSFYHVGSGTQTQVVWLSDKYFYPLSYLTSPITAF